MRILFVDDEKPLLDGLRRLLMGKRKAWDMSFALSGHQALEILAETPHDLVIADMRMPGMDGAELLARIKCDHPESIRVVLSGHSDTRTSMKAAGYVHQYLSKPCPGPELVAAIERMDGQRALVPDPDTRRALHAIGTLPVLKTVLDELKEALGASEKSKTLVGRIIAKDMGLTSGLLKIVNTSFFGMASHPPTPEQVVRYLGLETLRTLVLELDHFSPLPQELWPECNLSSLGQHCTRTRDFATAIAGREEWNAQETDACGLAGLLHDVGKLAMISSLPEAYKQALVRARKENTSMFEAEQRTLGISHAEVGAYLLGLWGFSETVVSAVAMHHTLEGATPETCRIPAVVHAANVFEHKLTVLNPDYAPHPLRADMIEKCGLAPRLPAWSDACESL